MSFMASSICRQVCFELDGVLGSFRNGLFRNGLGAMCFQQLPRLRVDFDFSHVVMLLRSESNRVFRSNREP
jgi:hypothetical protein